MSGLITKMFIFVVLMVTGYFFAKNDPTSGAFTKSASRLVINVFMSATIINSVLTASMDFSWGVFGQVMLAMCAAIVIPYLLSAATARILRVEREHRAGFELLMSVPNNMFIALPVVEELFGSTAVFYCGMSNIPFNLILYTYGVWLLNQEQDGGKFHAKELLNVTLLAVLVAVVLFVTQLPVPKAFKDLIGAMAGGTMPLSMIVIGASLSTVSLFDAFRNWRFYVATFFKLLAAPLLVWLVCGFLTADPVLRATAMITAAAPSAVVVTVLTIKYNGDAIFTSEGILHSTCLSMLTIPLLVYFLV